MCFFFKQKTAYEMRISDWSSDVCSSDLAAGVLDDEVTDLDAGGAHEPGPAKARAGSVLTALRNPTPPATSDTSTAMTGICQKRSEERRVGKECVSTCRSRWSP